MKILLAVWCASAVAIKDLDYGPGDPASRAAVGAPPARKAWGGPL